jgi:hypothetical protein
MDDTIFITSSATNCGLIAVSFFTRASANILLRLSSLKPASAIIFFNLGSEEQSTIAIFVLSSIFLLN